MFDCDTLELISRFFKCVCEIFVFCIEVLEEFTTNEGVLVLVDIFWAKAVCPSKAKFCENFIKQTGIESRILFHSS